MGDRERFLAEVMASPLFDSQIMVSVGKYLIRHVMFSDWAAGEGDRVLASKEYAEFWELQDAKWRKLERAWEDLREKDSIFRSSLARVRLNSPDVKRAERDSQRRQLAESSGYIGAQRRFVEVLDELVELSVLVAPIGIWMPRCSCCGSDVSR